MVLSDVHPDQLNGRVHVLGARELCAHKVAVPYQHGDSVPTWAHVMYSIDAGGIPFLEGRLPEEGPSSLAL